MTPVIELQEVKRYFSLGSETVMALNGVTMVVERGEMVAILGASGSGKSTLMNVIGCLDRPSDGQYLLDGHDVSKFSDNQLSDVRGTYIGSVFQSYNLLPQLNAIENVELPLRYNSQGKNRRQAAIAALDKVGLADRAKHRPSEMSGGQQQRVAIARALVSSPSLLLADEPTGNLDSRTTLEIMKLLQDLNGNDGMTILIITHEDEVATGTRRRVTMRDGEIVDDSSTHLVSTGKIDLSGAVI